MDGKELFEVEVILDTNIGFDNQTKIQKLFVGVIDDKYYIGADVKGDFNNQTMTKFDNVDNNDNSTNNNTAFDFIQKQCPNGYQSIQEMNSATHFIRGKIQDGIKFLTSTLNNCPIIISAEIIKSCSKINVDPLIHTLAEKSTRFVSIKLKD